MNDLQQKLAELKNQFSDIKPSLSLDKKREKLAKLTEMSTDPNLWDNPQNAQKIMREVSALKKEIEAVEKLDEDLSTLYELAKLAGSTEDLNKEVNRVESVLKNITLSSFLSGAYDDRGAIVSVHAGQGGTEAMDWVSMLYRMYLRYSERMGWDTENLDYTAGEEAGIKSVTFRVDGSYAYGYLRREAGTHRLVRQSPFNADKLRQTSFALVEVLPNLEDLEIPEIEIKDSDLEWQFFRASSQGGQNVQKVSTAVRVKHLPTGIVTQAQAERFQEQNRKNALDLLRAKLWLLEEEKKARQVKDLKGEYRPASWGTQIRSYVLHPYKMVKDLRTEYETSNTEGVLDGELEGFIEEEIRKIK